MSVKLYPKAAQKLWESSINWVTDTIKVVALDSTYLYDAADEFYTDLTGVVGSPVELLNKTNVLGVLDADNTIFPSLAGNAVQQVVIFKDTGTPATSPVLLFVDEGNNLPFTPDGSDATMQWDDSAKKIAKTETC